MYSVRLKIFELSRASRLGYSYFSAKLQLDDVETTVASLSARLFSRDAMLNAAFLPAFSRKPLAMSGTPQHFSGASSTPVSSAFITLTRSCPSERSL